MKGAAVDHVPSAPRRLHVVPSSSADPRVRRRAALVAIVLCVVTVVFGVLLERVALTQSAFKLAQLRDQAVAAETRHKELLLEASRLASPDRIEGYARSALGMVDPSVVEYIVADVPTADVLQSIQLGARPATERADGPVGAWAEEAAP